MGCAAKHKTRNDPDTAPSLNAMLAASYLPCG
jgi:hypothetical protein